MADLPGYDQWKTTPPPEPLSDDPDCTCTTSRRDQWCPIHGRDPDEERDKRRERDWDRELSEREAEWELRRPEVLVSERAVFVLGPHDHHPLTEMWLAGLLSGDR